MKYVICLTLTMTCYLTGFSQQKKLKPEKKNLEYYVCTVSDSINEDCVRLAEAAMGFRTVNMGCIINPRIKRKFDRNNRMVARKLTREYGPNWKEILQNGIAECKVQ